jgi:hypothetical protein
VRIGCGVAYGANPEAMLVTKPVLKPLVAFALVDPFERDGLRLDPARHATNRAALSHGVAQPSLARYNSAKGLKTIVLAQASEKHWARAKNTDKLFDAVEAKLKEQASHAAPRTLRLFTKP